MIAFPLQACAKKIEQAEARARAPPARGRGRGRGTARSRGGSATSAVAATSAVRPTSADWIDGRVISISVQFDDDYGAATDAAMATSNTAATTPTTPFNFTEMVDWNKSKDAKVQGRRCDVPGCLLFIVGTSRNNCESHAKHKHKPSAADAEERKSEEARQRVAQTSLGEKGKGIMDAFIAKAKTADHSLEPPAIRALRTAEPPSHVAPRLPPARIDCEEEDSMVELQRLVSACRVADSPAIVFCKGFKLNMQHPTLNYPFQLHDPDYFVPLAWSWPNEDGVVHARKTALTEKCTRLVEQGSLSESCGPCMRLKDNTKLKDLVIRSANAQLHESSNHNEFLSHAQLSARIRRKAARGNELKMEMMVSRSKMRSLLKLPDANDRLLSALCIGSMPRLHVLVRRMRDKGDSQYMITKAIEQVASGERKIVGDWDERELKAAYLHVAFGGQRALHVARRTTGAMTHRTLTEQTLFNVPRFIADSGLLRTSILVPVVAVRAIITQSQTTNEPPQLTLFFVHFVHDRRNGCQSSSRKCKLLARDIPSP